MFDTKIKQSSQGLSLAGPLHFEGLIATGQTSHSRFMVAITSRIVDQVIQTIFTSSRATEQRKK